MAAVLAAGPTAVASHLSAAVVWEFRGTSPEGVEITVSGRRPRLDRVLVHRVDAVPEPDRCCVGGIPVTSAARTLVDLSGSWTRGQLVGRARRDAPPARHQPRRGRAVREPARPGARSAPGRDRSPRRRTPGCLRDRREPPRAADLPAARRSGRRPPDPSVRSHGGRSTVPARLREERSPDSRPVRQAGRAPTMEARGPTRSSTWKSTASTPTGCSPTFIATAAGTRCSSPPAGRRCTSPNGPCLPRSSTASRAFSRGFDVSTLPDPGPSGVWTEIRQ